MSHFLNTASLATHSRATVNLTSHDLYKNLNGRLSKGQREYLVRQRRKALAGALGFTLVLIHMAVVLFLKLRDPSFASNGELFFWVPAGLACLWLLRNSFKSWRQINQDLLAGAIAMAEGQISGDLGLNFGKILMRKYRIHIAGQTFLADRGLFFLFKDRAEYRVFYSPNSNQFLGALQLDQDGSATPTLEGQIADVEANFPENFARPGPQEGGVKTAEADSPIDSRELEILRLIAAAKSNREIADELSLSVNTLKFYNAQLYRKLGARRRTEAISRARRMGLL